MTLQTKKLDMPSKHIAYIKKFSITKSTQAFRRSKTSEDIIGADRRLFLHILKVSVSICTTYCFTSVLFTVTLL